MSQPALIDSDRANLRRDPAPTPRRRKADRAAGAWSRARFERPDSNWGFPDAGEI